MLRDGDAGVSTVLEEPPAHSQENGVEVGEGASVESFHVKDAPPLEEAWGRVVQDQGLRVVGS